jgi:hypothetical protein
MQVQHTCLSQKFFSPAKKFALASHAARPEFLLIRDRMRAEGRDRNVNMLCRPKTFAKNIEFFS